MKKKILYEVSMSILAITAVILALLDLAKGLLSWQIIIDNIILIKGIPEIDPNNNETH